MDGTLTSTTTQGQSSPGINCNVWVLPTPRSTASDTVKCHTEDSLFWRDLTPL